MAAPTKPTKSGVPAAPLTPPPAEGIEQQLEEEKTENLRSAVMILYNEDITESTGIVYNKGKKTKIDGTEEESEEIEFQIEEDDEFADVDND